MVFTTFALLVSCLSFSTNEFSYVAKTTDNVNQVVDYTFQASNLAHTSMDSFEYSITFEVDTNDYSFSLDDAINIRFFYYTHPSGNGYEIQCRFNRQVAHSNDYANLYVSCGNGTGLSNVTFFTTYLYSQYYSEDTGNPYLYYDIPENQVYTSFQFHFYLGWVNEYVSNALISNNGFNDGYNTGYQDGYNSGYDTGYLTGSNSDSSSSYSTGYTNGYNVGYNDGVQVNTPQFMTLFGAIADTPVLMFRSLFNFDLFGTPMLTIVLSLFTLLVVLHLAKKVIKG